MKYRRINLFGGPGVGKSICASKLFGDLKLRGYLIEQVSEYAKTWAHQKRAVDVYTQLYFLSKQIKSERECLTSGYDLIVTDSPLGLCPLYTSEYFPKDAGWATSSMWGYIRAMDAEYAPLNILIRRDNAVKYETEGRYQSFTEASQIDTKLYKMSERFGGFDRPEGFSVSEYTELLNYIVQKLETH